MPEFTLKARIQNKYKSLAEWNQILENEFIPLKGEVIYAVENNILYQKIGDGETDFTKLNWLKSQAITPDWAENDPEAANYIANRTHYDISTKYIPDRAENGVDVYWDGSGLEVSTDEESELLAQGIELPEGAEWLARADISDGEGGYISRITTTLLTESDMQQIPLSAIIVNSITDDGSMAIMPASDSLLFADEDLEVAVYNLNDLLPGYIPTRDVGYGLFVGGGTPFLVVLAKPMSWTYLGVDDGTGVEKYAPPGTYGLDFVDTITIAQVVCEKVKQLEGKYIGNYPDVSVNEYSSYSRITITDKNNKTKTVTVRNGQDGVPGKNGTNGKDGATFTPYVDASGYLRWTNTVGATNPSPVKVQYQEEWPTDEHIMELIERVMVTKEW